MQRFTRERELLHFLLKIEGMKLVHDYAFELPKGKNFHCLCDPLELIYLSSFWVVIITCEPLHYFICLIWVFPHLLDFKQRGCRPSVQCTPVPRNRSEKTASGRLSSSFSNGNGACIGNFSLANYNCTALELTSQHKSLQLNVLKPLATELCFP